MSTTTMQLNVYHSTVIIYQCKNIYEASKSYRYQKNIRLVSMIEDNIKSIS